MASVGLDSSVERGSSVEPDYYAEEQRSMFAISSSWGESFEDIFRVPVRLVLWLLRDLVAKMWVDYSDYLISSPNSPPNYFNVCSSPSLFPESVQKAVNRLNIEKLNVKLDNLCKVLPNFSDQIQAFSSMQYKPDHLTEEGDVLMKKCDALFQSIVDHEWKKNDGDRTLHLGGANQVISKDFVCACYRLKKAPPVQNLYVDGSCERIEDYQRVLTLAKNANVTHLYIQNIVFGTHMNRILHEIVGFLQDNDHISTITLNNERGMRLVVSDKVLQRLQSIDQTLRRDIKIKCKNIKMLDSVKELSHLHITQL